MYLYGQYCPSLVRRDRRRPLDAAHRRELLAGVERFNDLDRGLPGISRALLVNGSAAWSERGSWSAAGAEPA